MHYVQRIKEERKLANLTQKNIADRLHITQQQYQAYETQKNEMPIRYLIEICKILNISADYILGLSEYKDIRNL